MMIKFLWFFLIVNNVWGLALTFKKENEVVMVYQLVTIKQGKLSKADKKISSENKRVYNIWRKYEKNYTGYDFTQLLNLVYGREWQEYKSMIFTAMDGYRQKTSIKEMIKNSASKTGFLAYKEAESKGFTGIKKENKIIDPGPLYLLWSGFNKNDDSKHSDVLKWPYQLKEIKLSNK